jgi:CheY-like chemotaxis protein
MPETGRRPRVLVVDDEPFILAVLADLLQARGITCATAVNGAEALTALETAKPDLVILDITMPVMDGIETCRRLKADPGLAAIPVIALTSHDDPHTVFTMMEAGSLLYITKPVSAERLMSAIDLALNIAAS